MDKHLKALLLGIVNDSDIDVDAELDATDNHETLFIVYSKTDNVNNIDSALVALKISLPFLQFDHINNGIFFTIA